MNYGNDVPAMRALCVRSTPAVRRLHRHRVRVPAPVAHAHRAHRIWGVNEAGEVTPFADGAGTTALHAAARRAGLGRRRAPGRGRGKPAHPARRARGRRGFDARGPGRAAVGWAAWTERRGPRPSACRWASSAQPTGPSNVADATAAKRCAPSALSSRSFEAGEGVARAGAAPGYGASVPRGVSASRRQDGSPLPGNAIAPAGSGTRGGWRRFASCAAPAER
jgi:hypothetical protein